MTGTVPTALRLLAKEIGVRSKGHHVLEERLAEEKLLDVLTDQLLVVAVDAVEAAVNDFKERPSGKAQLRLLGWTVAAARGAVTNMEPALAETVGKRLNRQAEKVRADIAAARAHAAEARSRARAAADADASLAAELAATLAAIDTREQRELEKPAFEVYIGFHELHGLLPPPPPPPAAESDAAPACTTRPEPADRQPAAGYSFVRYPWLMEGAAEEAAAGDPCGAPRAAMPPDLVAALGPECTREKTHS